MPEHTSEHTTERETDPKSSAHRTVPVRTERARVHPDQRDALEAIIDRLYQRRTLLRLSTWDQMRYGPEIADFLRRRSAVYRALSGEAGTEGPLPFALGYFRVVERDAGEARLEPIADALPAPQPELLARLLSEFLRPGARLVFGEGKAAATWEIEGEDQVRSVDS